MKVTEVASGFKSPITMNLYHSNQGVHFQGGRRHGNKTSCSLAADFSEELFKGIFTNQRKTIVKDKDIQTLFNCKECHYKTFQLTELKRHKFKQHSIGKTTEEKPTQLVQQVQVPKMDCIHCKFDCDDNDELEAHIEEHHKIKQEEIHFNSSQCSECRAKDATLNEQVQKIQRLKLVITNVESNLAASELERSKVLEQNEAIKSEYQKVTCVVAEQQRKLTENAEILKTKTDLEIVGEETKKI